MSTLLDSLAAAFHGDSVRRVPLEQALRDGLPGPRSEAWKYTSLRALERRRFVPAADATADVDAAVIASIPAPRLVFVNGRASDALSELSGLPCGVALQRLSALLRGGEDAMRFLGRRFERVDDVFARLNAALADEGCVLRVDAGVRVETPLHLVFLSTAAAADLAWHHRHLIELGQNASLSLVEHHLHLEDAPHLSNSLAHIHLAAGAQLIHARVQEDAPGITALLRTDAVLAREAQYQRVDLELGGALVRHELNVRLEGDNARLSANGVLLGNGRRQLDTRLGIEHIARDTACELLWRGIATARSRVAFHGGIHIRQGADGSDAQLSNKNLLLSTDAEIDTQPVLVIDADEVKAAHGATVGQLDANALFYLRSRGLPQERAQQLLTAAFCREPLRLLPTTLGELLATHLERALSDADVT
ncbi:Fe-S cluster assembly protein SufD [Xanthomonas albilineans]|uniref:Fe-S cluster assembly protein SufD n=1 Tax=Xanthomonas albilineans TaxID=29447 RepID=UPI0005F34F24|nr:Fe-S cluster assembly protein SufD [Xanthomonas albilineans]